MNTIISSPDAGFDADDYGSIARTLRFALLTDNEGLIRATLSNSLNIILASLERCAKE